VVVRRYDDTIDVRMQGDEQEAGAQPAAFVWRDRLYVVRAVQTRWYERRAWWREAAAAALLGLRGDESRADASRDEPLGDLPDDAPSGRAEASRQGGSASPSVAAGGYLDGETEVWRVEAAAGRSSPVGVFDLARSVPATTAASVGAVGASSGWRLTRVAD
jgi:hypothetical protein